MMESLEGMFDGLDNAIGAAVAHPLMEPFTDAYARLQEDPAAAAYLAGWGVATGVMIYSSIRSYRREVRKLEEERRQEEQQLRVGLPMTFDQEVLYRVCRKTGQMEMWDDYVQQRNRKHGIE